MRLNSGTWLVTYGVTGSLGSCARLDCASAARDLPMRIASIGGVVFPSESGNPLIETDRRMANGAKVNARFKIRISGNGVDSINIDRAFFRACQANGWQSTSVEFFTSKLPSNGGSGVINTIRVAVGGLLGAIAAPFTGGLSVAATASAASQTGDFRSVSSEYRPYPDNAPVGAIERDAIDRFAATQVQNSSNRNNIGQPTPPSVNPGQVPSFDLPLQYQIAIGATVAIAGAVAVGYVVRSFK